MHYPRYFFLCALVLSTCLLDAQQTARIASLKSQAFTLFDRGQYSEVAGTLEEVWEQDQSDAKVAEYLAIGYLYGERSAEKAKPLMRAAIERGGQATFLAVHSHERGKLLSGSTISNYCTGRLSLVPAKLSFVAESGDHSTEFSASDLKEIKFLGGSPGRLQLKSAGKTYVFRVKSETSAEASLLEELVKQHVR